MQAIPPRFFVPSRVLHAHFISLLSFSLCYGVVVVLADSSG